MNSGELKKLNRKMLLEILLEQSKRIEELEKELEKTQNELNNKKILIKESGSIAEASLKLSDIFKSADEAVQIYIKNALEQMK